MNSDTTATREPDEPERTAVVFEMDFDVTEDEMDGMNHANNVVYLHWVLRAATAHWQAATTPQQQADFRWVVVRHEIDYLSPAFAEDNLRARTWVGEVSGAKFERFVEIWRPGEERLLARARSVWVAIDARTGRPCRVKEELRLRFFS